MPMMPMILVGFVLDVARPALSAAEAFASATMSQMSPGMLRAMSERIRPTMLRTNSPVPVSWAGPALGGVGWPYGCGPKPWLQGC